MENKQQKQTNTLIIVLTLMFGYSIMYMDKSMISLAIVPLAKQFGFDNSQTGLMMSLYFFSYSILQLVLGRLADKLGSKVVLIISMAMSAVASVFFGFASSLFMFCSIRLLSGIAHSGYPSSCSRTVADNFPLEKRSMIQSFMISTSGIGGLMAFVIGASLVSKSWNSAYLFLGAMQAIAAVLIFILIPNKKSEISNTPAAKMNYTKVLFNKNVIILCITLFLFNFLAYGINSWASKYLQEVFQISIKTSGIILAVNAVASTIASMGIGILLTKVLKGKEKLYASSALIMAGIFVFALSKTSTLAIATVLLVLAFALAVSAFATLISWPHRILPREVIGSSMGIINGLGTFGGFFAPVILGMAIDKSGGSFESAFVILAIAGFLSGIFAIFLSNNKIEL